VVVTPEVQHSALITNPAGAGGIHVSRKNGFNELQADCTLNDVMKVYERTKSSIQFYRRKSA
jgi:hypothetical protein